MSRLKIFNFKFCFVVGLGYWKDYYFQDEIVGINGVINTLIVPFVVLQWGYVHKISD